VAVLDIEGGGMTRSWEELCDEGRELVAAGDGGKWKMGDLAIEVQKEYGKNRIAEFAKEVNAPVSRVREYRTVCKFYPKNSARDEILEHNPCSATATSG
jgi:hypothetical protein